ncbi:MAG: prepilin-type N-terminal cleavage/methylation domain-containing protein [Legionellaceae bacterium]|nr:prepilin-type N-terminal cleavage/methylation domain-containing protein [Legionellaceae bacterium]
MRTAKGFTLIELILVIVLVAILGATSSLILSQTFKAYFTGKKIADLAVRTNIASDNVIRELKSAESLTALGATTLTFINQQGQTVVIDLSGTTLRRNVDATGAQILCTQVTNLSFGFFDQTYAVTAVAANVRFITMEIKTTNDGYPYSLIGGTVLCRSKINNLEIC